MGRILILCVMFLAVFNSNIFAGNGGGYKITGSGMNYPEPPSWATLGVNIDTLNLQSSWLRYYYPNMELKLISTSITEVSVEGATVMITGIGTVHGNEGFAFTVTINDGNVDAFGIQSDPRPDPTSPVIVNNDNVDAFGIEIRDPEGAFYYAEEVTPIVRGDFIISTR